MATYIFDFDDTLFDNARLKSDIYAIFNSFQVADEHILDAYKSVRHNYNYGKHVDAIKDKYKDVEHSEILEKLNELDMPTYVFDGIPELLNKLGTENTLILLSYGEKDFQEKKIFESGINNYFKKENIHITSGDKALVLKELKLTEPVYFINDKSSENESIEKVFPTFSYHLVTPENRVKDIIG